MIDELRSASALERVTALATRGYLTNQLLRDIDAVSMAHSLEVRVPYLDTVVVDTALSLPDAAKLGDVTLRRSAEQLFVLAAKVRGHCQLVEQPKGVAYSPYEHTSPNQPI